MIFAHDQRKFDSLSWSSCRRTILRHISSGSGNMQVGAVVGLQVFLSNLQEAGQLDGDLPAPSGLILPHIGQQAGWESLKKLLGFLCSYFL